MLKKKVKQSEIRKRFLENNEKNSKTIEKLEINGHEHEIEMSCHSIRH
jgi:hypothetical protein